MVFDTEVFNRLKIRIEQVTDPQNHSIEDMSVFRKLANLFWIRILLWSFRAFPCLELSLKMDLQTPQNPKPTFSRYEQELSNMNSKIVLWMQHTSTVHTLESGEIFTF